MNKILLSKEHISDLVLDNQYEVDITRKFISRCIDGRYPNVPGLPALAIPGADAGELSVLYAAANQFGFKVHEQKALYVLKDLVGEKNFSFHAHCGHLNQLSIDPEAFHLTSEQIKTIIDVQLPCAVSYGAKETPIDGEHTEGAVLQIRGSKGIFPQYDLMTDSGAKKVQVFMYHSTLVNERRKEFITKLLKAEAVTLYNGLGEEYFYEVLSSTGEDHLFEISKRLAKGLPMYEVVFNDKGGFEINDLGTI